MPKNQNNLNITEDKQAEFARIFIFLFCTRNPMFDVQTEVEGSSLNIHHIREKY